MTDRLAGIHEFVAVVEAGGFAAAAARLNLSRSAVGKTVARLEARLGVRLCHRTTRALSLTDDGQAFYERCVRVLAELEAGEAALESGRLEPSGKVRISVPVVFGRRCVAPVLYEAARQYRQLKLEVSFTDRPVDLIEEGYDLAVRNGNLRNANLRNVAGLMTRTLARQRMTVCGSPAYLAARGHPVALEDLAAHEAIGYARGGDTTPWIFPARNGAMVEAPIESRIRLDDLEAISDAAAAGMGLAWLPCWLIRERVASGELVRLLDNRSATEFNSSAIWPQTPFLPSRVRVLIDALAARLPAMMG
jgi:DNA-binding transcriptional LysR family regulator